MAKSDSGEVARQKVDARTLQLGAAERIEKSALRDITSFEDALKVSAEVHGEIQNFADEYGTGFDVVDKAQFVEKPLVLLEWRFSQGDYGSKFVIASVVAQDGMKGIITDGSTGLCAQLLEISFNDGRYGGLFVNRGLRSSTYTTCECGMPRRPEDEACESCGSTTTSRGTGITYYLDESKSG